jgi:hypothetical protein
MRVRNAAIAVGLMQEDLSEKRLPLFETPYSILSPDCVASSRRTRGVNSPLCGRL